MIYYDYMFERWEDAEDYDFRVDMTPESREDCERTFTTREDFLVWYNSDGG